MSDLKPESVRRTQLQPRTVSLTFRGWIDKWNLGDRTTIHDPYVGDITGKITSLSWRGSDVDKQTEVWIVEEQSTET